MLSRYSDAKNTLPDSPKVTAVVSVQAAKGVKQQSPSTEPSILLPRMWSNSEPLAATVWLRRGFVRVIKCRDKAFESHANSRRNSRRCAQRVKVLTEHAAIPDAGMAHVVFRTAQGSIPTQPRCLPTYPKHPGQPYTTTFPQPVTVLMSSR